MSSKVSSSESPCTISLFSVDRRESDPRKNNSSAFSFYKQTADKANDIVCDHFGVKEEWDKNLLKCVFLDDVDFNEFEFFRKDAPDIAESVHIKGNRNIVFNEGSGVNYQPIENTTHKISVSVVSVFGDNAYDLTYEQIAKERSGDFSVIALYNCSSYSRLSECSTNLGFVRTLEKLPK